METIANAVQVGTYNANKKKGKKAARLFKKKAKAVGISDKVKNEARAKRIQELNDAGRFNILRTRKHG